MMSNLAGLQIIITRPKLQAENWAKILCDLGASVSLVPLMEIVPVSLAAQIQPIKNCILNLDGYSKVIFVSQNAVVHGMEWIDRYWPQLPTRLEYFAVGAATAAQLAAHDLIVQDLAQVQDGPMTSETLLDSPSLQDVGGQKIVIFRGVGGRSHLGDVLTARGAQVDYCELYERRLPEQACAEFSFCVTSTPATLVRVVTLHSGEALENLVTALAAMNLRAEFLPFYLALLVPSLRVASQAQQLGFNTIYVAANATDASMLQGLIDLKNNLTKV
jgi:uroporphyrinogen-III synthase